MNGVRGLESCRNTCDFHRILCQWYPCLMATQGAGLTTNPLTPEGVKAVTVVTPVIVCGPTDCITALRPYGGTQIFGRYSHFRNIGTRFMHNSKPVEKWEL
ncbi:hypothetical protein CDAR_420841 [Caerostris darwini]|uniref:Uncharacterized protein n=1 Tax=Caerostris darwini TaxID=1538125 RepID=A0AAV4X0P2_9ARAC|nr:hypothetical protein CDAR_420841 [Caerostris darwini]